MILGYYLDSFACYHISFGGTLHLEWIPLDSSWLYIQSVFENAATLAVKDTKVIRAYTGSLCHSRESGFDYERGLFGG